MHDSQMPSRRICMYAMMSPLVFLTTPALHNFRMHSCPGVCQRQGAASPVFLIHLPFNPKYCEMHLCPAERWQRQFQMYTKC